MTITKQINENVATILLEGWLDTQTSPQFGEVLNGLEKDVTSLVLDFEKLEYISSAGLRQIVTAYKKMRGDMKIVHVSKEIMEVFKMTGFDKKLNIQ